MQQRGGWGQVFFVESPSGTQDCDVGGRSRVIDGIDWAVSYADCAGDLFGFLARRVGRDLAEDLLADTFASAMTTETGFDPRQGTVRTWLFGIASNLVRRHWRTEERRLRALVREGTEPAAPIDPLLTTAAVDDRLEASDTLEALIDELGRLSRVDRELLALTGWESMTSAEAGEVVGMNPATVRSRVRRARSRLRSVSEQGGGAFS